MAESYQFSENSTAIMDDDPEKRSITAPETDHEEHQVSDAGRTHGGQVTRAKMLTTLIICFCNLINFMDRYCLPGILPMVIADLKLSNFQGGLLQSAFVVSYVVVAPIVGYLGDRYSRRAIMGCGLLVWSIVTMAGSFMTTFETLLIFRCLGGIGEASYSAIGPAVIGDLYIGDTRSKMLALFYFTTLIGGGLGFITGSGMAAATSSWNWGLRVTPILSMVSVLLIAFVMRDPPRGLSEGSRLVSTSWQKDIVYLLKNPSLMLSTIASIAVTFTVGAIAAWGPQYVFLGRQILNDNSLSFDDISLVFGIVTIASGLLGVVSGSIMGQKLRIRFPSADAIICGIGMICSAPFFYALLVLSLGSIYAIYVLAFLALWFINLNWALVGDILLYVIIPTRRATAAAFQILVCHIFGDASSPFIVGLISDALKPTIESDSETFRNFKSLEYGLFVILFVEVLGGFFFLACSWFLVSDRAKATRAVAVSIPDQSVLYDKSKASQVHVFVPANDPATSGHTVMIKRSSQIMDEVNLETV
ncbi:protein spinster homolog 1 isoform X1 [Daphnia magna]|uniref:protein spinster homolog 1 isoform X1 n=1 Tax=Daphnia magna TaxID=35525 RepID=UPI001E1BBBF8|nr:protein spinster homolog 1 isoform X1 [Daphnia magna]